MNIRIIVLTFVLMLGGVRVYAQHWIYEKHSGGSQNDYGSRVAVDKDNNSYVAGEFSGTMMFDTITVSGPGKWNVYLAKYNPAGGVVWAKTIASTHDPLSDIYANAVAVDAAGNIFLTGGFVADVTFPDTAFTSVGSSDIYLAKFDGGGNIEWAKRAGGTGQGTFGQDMATAMGIDGAGNCYITGRYNTNAMFDSISISSPLTIEVFVAKYSGDGHALWAKSGGGIGSLKLALGLGVDAAGNSYITGSFFNELAFDGDTIETNDPEQKIFLAKFDANGAAQWLKEVGSGGYYGGAQDLALDREGNPYITGYFRASIRFDNNQEFSFNNGLEYAVLLAKYDRGGNYVWAARTGGDAQNAKGNRIAVNAHGDIFVTGAFESTASFGSTVLVGRGASGNPFIAKLDPEGRFAWARQISGTGSGNGIAATLTGECVAIGEFQDTVDIDSVRMTSAGGSDIFIVKLGEESAGVEDGAGELPALYLW